MNGADGLDDSICTTCFSLPPFSLLHGASANVYLHSPLWLSWQRPPRPGWLPDCWEHCLEHGIQPVSSGRRISLPRPPRVRLSASTSARLVARLREHRLKYVHSLVCHRPSCPDDFTPTLTLREVISTNIGQAGCQLLLGALPRARHPARWLPH